QVEEQDVLGVEQVVLGDAHEEAHAALPEDLQRLLGLLRAAVPAVDVREDDRVDLAGPGRLDQPEQLPALPALGGVLGAAEALDQGPAEQAHVAGDGLALGPEALALLLLGDGGHAQEPTETK